MAVDNGTTEAKVKAKIFGSYFMFFLDVLVNFDYC